MAAGGGAVPEKSVSLAWGKRDWLGAWTLPEHTEVWAEKALGPVTMETSVNPGEGRDSLLLTSQTYWLVHLLDLLALEATRPLATLVPRVGSKEEA